MCGRLWAWIGVMTSKPREEMLFNRLDCSLRDEKSVWLKMIILS
jgi:hypothetical protein